MRVVSDLGGGDALRRRFRAVFEVFEGGEVKKHTCRFHEIRAARGATVHFDIRHVSGGRTGAVASRTARGPFDYAIPSHSMHLPMASNLSDEALCQLMAVQGTFCSINRSESAIDTGLEWK